ncbi:MAG: TIGR02594 family protein [Saprospiraceae bacterium]|nr:TIGR02594 family protein [Saprospiraceae bacterium]
MSDIIEKIKQRIIKFEAMAETLRELFTSDDGKIDAEEGEQLKSIQTYIDKIKEKLSMQGGSDDTIKIEDISGSVGDGGKNVQKDVEIVQTLLKKHYKELKVDGDCGPKTIAAIRKFQEKLGFSRPDGRVDPKGTTWKGLTKGATVEDQTSSDDGSNSTSDNTSGGNDSSTNDDDSTKNNTPVDDGDRHYGIPDENMDNYDRPEPITELNGKKASLDKLTAKVGDKGVNKFEDVLAVQYYLNKHGYACPQDGKWDNKVSRQVAWFSRSCKDKEVGTTRNVSTTGKLWKYLKGEIERPEVDDVSDGYYDEDKQIDAPNHKLSGMVGNGKANDRDDVRAVQDLLNQWGNYNINEDGRWDNTCKVAMIDFQNQMGIDADGICGPTSWDYLIGKKKPEPKVQDTASGKNYGPKPKWISIAEGEIGVKEIPDKNSEKVNNPRVMEYHAASGGYSSDEPAWCASFTSWCLSKAGVSNPRDPGVIQWKGWGEKIDKPFYGCIGIIKTGSAWGHIGFIVGVEGGNVLMLGGNQSNSVKISKYSKSSVTQYLKPPGYEPPAEAWNLSALDGDHSNGNNESTR